MPPTRRVKLQAHAEHLLDAFLGLRSTFAMLEPVLFDQAVVERWGAGKRAHGLALITNTLLHSCVLGIAKIALDKDDRTPSVARLVEALEEPALLAELRESYAIWNLAPTAGDEPDVIALLQRMERREEGERRAKFDAHVGDLRAGWTALSHSAPLRSFGTMRDKLIAHNELWHNGKGYQPLDITTLGLKLGDLGVVIGDLQTLVDLLTLVYRNSSFAFDVLDEQLKTTRDTFWSTSP